MSVTRQPVKVGLIGAGLMGKELAGVLGRWCALSDSTLAPELTAVCDLNPDALEWFRRIPSVETFTTDYRRLLDTDRLDVLYIAIPHHLHEQVYVDAIEAGKDFLGEKPFGIDPAASENIVRRLRASAVFARCSSEMPFFPGAQRATKLLQSGYAGRIVEARFSFLHSSDLNQDKPINWKRQAEFCGHIGVMGDLGMHVMHVPLRLGWAPVSVFAQLQDLVTSRPDGRGGRAACDTIDNAYLLCRSVHEGREFPLHLETKRIAPGEMNTWVMRVIGTEGGVEFSTRSPQILRVMRVGNGEQVWQEVQVGSQSTHPTVTGAIFEFGFTDALLQMWASYLCEREGLLGARFGCVTPDEALGSHRTFDAALLSGASASAVSVDACESPLRRHSSTDVAGVIGRERGGHLGRSKRTGMTGEEPAGR